MLGQGWQFQWRRVHRRLNDVRAVYTGREGGTEDALDATLRSSRRFITSKTGSGMISRAG